MFVHHVPTPRIVEQISLRVSFAGACHKYEIISQKAIHSGCIVLFYGCLILGIQFGDGLLIIVNWNVRSVHCNRYEYAKCQPSCKK